MAKRKPSPTAPRCPICNRPVGAAEGACPAAGSQLCYQLGFTRVSELLASNKLRLAEIERKLTAALEQASAEEVEGG